MSWEMVIAWLIAGIMIVMGVILGVGQWIDYPVVVNGVLQTNTLIVHLIGSTIAAGIMVGYVVFLLKQSKDS